MVRIAFMRARMRTDGGAGMIGLSPSIHSIDQIKVIDRFRGQSGLSPESIPATADDHPSLSPCRDPTRRSDGRSRLVRSRPGQRRVRHQSTRSGLHVRVVHRQEVPGDQRDEPCVTSAPAVYGGLLCHVRRPTEYGMERTELLL
jgi:hypothetical protein